MANSTQRNVSDGSMTYLDISIKYQRRADISVFFNDVPAEAGTWSWVGTTDKRIAFTSVVPAGVEVLIKRTSQIDAIINIFAKGAKFNNSTMDTNFEQLLFLNQEAVEGAALTDIFNDVDFHRYRLTNLGDATGPRDAVNLQQLTSLTADSVSAAAASASAAAGSATTAAASAATSSTQALLAKDWATKLGSTVDGVDYSAKYYAQQASTELNASVQLAADWAAKTTGPVDGSEYSAKYWAQQAALVTAGVPRTSATGSAVMPTGTTAQRDASPVAGYTRYNTSLPALEYYTGTAWQSTKADIRSYWDVYLGAAQSVTPGVATRVNFNTAVRSAGVAITNSGATITVANTGWYEVGVAWRCTGDSAGVNVLELRVNAAVTRRMCEFGTLQGTTCHSAQVYLTAGDVLELYGTVYASANATFAAVDTTGRFSPRFTGRYLGPL